MKIKRRSWISCLAFVTMTAAVDARGQSAIDITERPVRLSRPAWVVGDVPDTVWMLVERTVDLRDGDQAKRLLAKAESLAREALVGHEQNADRRFALAVVLGARAEREGGRTKVRLASTLNEELQELLALDPGHAGGHYLTGRLHAAARRMNGVTRWLATKMLGGGMLANASWAKAEEHLSFAESHASSVPDHHLQLAQLYRDTDRPELALAEVRHVLELNARSPLELVALGEALTLISELEEDADTNAPVR